MKAGKPSAEDAADAGDDIDDDEGRGEAVTFRP